VISYRNAASASHVQVSQDRTFEQSSDLKSVLDYPRGQDLAARLPRKCPGNVTLVV